MGGLKRGATLRGRGVRLVHGRIEDEFWAIDGGFRLEEGKIWRQVETLMGKGASSIALAIAMRIRGDSGLENGFDLPRIRSDEKSSVYSVSPLVTCTG